MINLLKRETIYLWYYFSVQLEQILPYWAVGIFLGSAISVFGKEKIHKLFRTLQQTHLGVLGILPASLLGIISPLCMYGTIPIAASFSQKGVKEDWLAAFMMSSILLNPQLLAYSAVLGREVIILRLFSCFLCGVTAGLWIHIFYGDRPFFNFSGFTEPQSRDKDPNLLSRFLKNIGRNIRVTGGYFLLGILLAALFQRYVPSHTITTLFGKNNKFGIFLAATLSIPLYTCGGGAIPLLMDWLHNGMGIGAAAAFMIVGPATKITNLGALKIILGGKHFILYFLFVFLFAIITGILVNFF